jgi:predicted ATPase/DNA-binding CsgD family transcriptional regulator
MTPLIGREKEVAEVVSLVLDPAVRLLTLTGPGGVGKTRLAVAAASHVGDAFPDGVVFIDLSSVMDPGLVLNAVATSLGLRDTGAEALEERVVTAIADRHLLLVLDNFEQVVVSASRIRGFLDACPEAVLLITSRIRLRISGEREFPVSPLSLAVSQPDDEDDMSGAVRLFFERAQAVRPDFEPSAQSTPIVADIVRRVDGLPLAIELAAARIRALPPAALLRRLEHRLPMLSGGGRDLPLRQQTMRDTIGWSYDLLDDARQQALFRHLGVFVGGFTLHAAEAIAADPLAGSDGLQSQTSIDVLDGITALIEHSLLQQVVEIQGEPRYQMLETVREYARELLAASSEREDVERRHAAFFLAMAEANEPELTGPNQAPCVKRLQHDVDNFRAVLHRALTHHEDETAIRLGASLWRFWECRGYLSDGRSQLATLLDLPSDPKLLAARCGALTGAGVLAALQGDYDQAIRHSEEALSGWRQLGNPQGTGRALLCLAEVARFQDDYPRAESLGRQALAAYRSIDDRWGIGHSLAHLGMVAWLRGDHSTKAALYEEALAHLRDVRDQSGLFQLLLEMGKDTCDAGDLARASRLFEECLALSTTMGDEGGRGAALAQLGVVARLQGDHDRAKNLLADAAKLAQDSGDRRQRAWVAAYLGDVHFSMEDIESAVAGYAEALRIFLPLGNRVGIAQCLEEVGKCAASVGHASSAVRFLGASTAMFAAVGVTPPADRDPAIDVASLRSTLTSEEFARAWDAGMALSSDEAAAEAFTYAASLEDDVTKAKPQSSGNVVQEAGTQSAPPDGHSPSVELTLGLTPREVEVLRLLVDGKSDREIADALSISERTAGNHVQHAMQKIGVESRTAAAVFAVRNQLG